MIAIGLVTGTLAARGLSRALTGLLFGVATTDVLTAVVAMTVLAAIGLIATLAQRGGRPQSIPLRC